MGEKKKLIQMRRNYSRRKFFLFLFFSGSFVVISCSIVFIVLKYDQYVRPPLRKYYHYQDESELIFPEELQLAPDIIECFKFFGRGEWEYEEYKNYIYHERAETYDVVEDEYGFKYKVSKCPSFPISFFPKFHFWRAILTVWDEYTKLLDIEWFLFFGGLIAVVRDDGNPLQWDFDVDIIVNREDVKKIEKYIPQNILDHWFMFVHPDHERDPRERKSRYRCSFPEVEPGRCNFQEPVARLIHDSEPYKTFLDIFGFQKVGNSNNIIYFEEGSYGFSFSEDQMKPVKKCEYYGVELNCPAKGDEIVSALYGENYTEVPYICDPVTLEWVRVKNVKDKVYYPPPRTKY